MYCFSVAPAGKWWGPRNRQPILALHGWQDNAGTFDRLCPLLPADTPVLCIDLPGHGRSTHYPAGMQYFLFWDGIALVRRIVRHFNWQRVTLLGHSLGGALCFMYAASFPDDVHRLIGIDIAGPTVRSLSKTAAGTGAAIDRALNYEQLSADRTPCYRYEEMIDVVLDAYAGSVTRDSAMVLMRRGMAPAVSAAARSGTAADQPPADAYHFARDLRLKVSLLGMFSLEQVLSYAEQIRAEVLNIRGRPGMRFEDEASYAQTLEAMRTHAKRVVYREVDGTHHLHLDTPERVAPVIVAFLSGDISDGAEDKQA